MPIRPDLAPVDLSEVQHSIRSILLSMGFEKMSHTATRFKSYAGVFQKAAFALSYLFPPLSVIQAAYGKRSRLSSAVHYPFHLLSTFGEFRKRKQRDAAL